jgi:hypothetical protein
MRRLNGVYTQAFNRRHGRVGHVFQGRYKAILVEKEGYLLELCRYLVLNPVRARMTRRAETYPWSSYRATTGQSQAPDWLAVDQVLGFFPGRSPAAAYARFVVQGIGRPPVWDALRGQIYLGGDKFLARMQRKAEGKPVRGVPASQQRPARPSGIAILDAVAKVYRTSAKAITGRQHWHPYRAAVYLLRRAANLPLVEVAKIMGISPPRVSQIQKEIEDEDMDSRLLSLARRYKVKP